MTQRLLLRALQLQIRPPDTLHPADGESGPNYLQRVLTAGRDARDWALVYRVLQAQPSSLTGFSPAELALDLGAFRLFFTGLNLERAGQVASAVRSYLGSLRAAGPNLPVEEIGRRLKELKAEHPQEFATAENTPEPANLPPFSSLPGTDPRATSRSTPPPPALPPVESTAQSSPTPPRAP